MIKFQDLFHPRPNSSVVSSDYQIIANPNRAALKKKYARVWQDKTIPAKQLALTQKQVPDFTSVPAMKTLVEEVAAIATKGAKVLEVGCSTGYHGEIFSRANLPVSYTGCDYSSAFIKLAREIYPQFRFDIADATRLPYKNKSFSIVISGCCLLHILDYPLALAQSVRVSQKYVILHRTPVIHFEPTTYTEKLGYGLPMVEIIFNENELMELFRKSKLRLQTVTTLSRFFIPGLKDPVYMKNYVCFKDS